MNAVTPVMDRMSGLKKEIISELLDRGNVYEVGGCVRDSLLDRSIAAKDRDYVITGIPLDDLVGILRRFGRVDLVGKSFGVIKFTARNAGTEAQSAVDIALPRREHSTGLAHRAFAVEFDHTLPIESDLRRRDFTINAMAVDLGTGKLVDPLGGLSDLNNRLLRMIDPSNFEEDPLRILRGIQFAARFELTVEPETFAAMRASVGLMSTVTAERINEELSKLLTRSSKPSHGFMLMQELGLLELIFPELRNTISVTQPGGYHAFNVFEHLLHTMDAAAPSLRLRWAALLHDITKPQAKRMEGDGATFYGHEASGARMARDVLRRLRYPNELVHEVGVLVERHMFTIPQTDKGLRRLVRRTGVDLIFDLLDLRRADVIGQGMGNRTDDVDEFERRIRDELERMPPFSVTDLKINGRDLMTLFDIPESPVIGEILAYLLDIVLDDPDKNEREILIEKIRDYLRIREIQ